MASMSPATDPTKILSETVPADESCQLLGPTALVVQGVLGVLVILSLVYKRHREPRKRPWKIWLFDVSKQIVGQMFVHGVNVILSGFVSELTSGNACVFYFLHILLDTTLGVAFLYVIHRALTRICTEKLMLKGFESGVYGSPPLFKYWARQAALYVLALTTMKILVITLFVVFPGIFSVGEWLLSWTRVGTGDSLQVIFTMGIFPIIMNILQFWLIDSIVKATTMVSLDEDTQDIYAAQDREPLFRAPSDDEDDSDYRVHDPENVRPPSQRHYDLSNCTSSVEEFKRSGTSSSDEPDHSYPPSLSRSNSSGSVQHKPATNLLKKAKRRPAPAPLSLKTNNPPAVNSPGIIAQAASQETLPRVPRAAPERKGEVVDDPGEAWAETWEDSDDWANRVEEEEWAGPRIAERKDTIQRALDNVPAHRAGS
ncbi:putative STIMATE family protein [Lyophyllum shimeji]|uniref:STIMATE family protein n=1 Tax=Lyophyllum shimeji TaxID=47721 RepID=A0A9P3PEV2_LYOSH|nr:putative STIMATE family protein [Lyophyllum shimeji]